MDDFLFSEESLFPRKHSYSRKLSGMSMAHESNHEWPKQDSDSKRERDLTRRESVMLWHNDPKKSKNGRRRSSVLRFLPQVDAQDEVPLFDHLVVGGEGEELKTAEFNGNGAAMRRMSNKLSQLFLLDLDGGPAAAPSSVTL